MTASSSKTVIKLNNIPHGFYEEQMKKYFSQFGQVRHILLIRSKKTHKSRGFGFVEFNLPQVATAAAESMHNYLLFDQVLKCRLMKKDDLPKNLFKIKYTGPTSIEKTKKKHNVYQRDIKKLRQHYYKILDVQEKLKKMGIKFECHIINLKEQLPMETS